MSSFTPAPERRPQPLDETGAKVIAEALAETESCPILLEKTAGTHGPLGRDFDELADLIELPAAATASGSASTPATCSSGYDVTDGRALTEIVDEADAKVGLDRLRACTSTTRCPARLESRPPRQLGKGEMGEKGLAVFLSDPRFEGLPATLETPGAKKKGSDKKEVQAAKRLRKTGLKRRG